MPPKPQRAEKKPLKQTKAAERQRKYQQENKEKYSEYQRKWRERNKVGVATKTANPNDDMESTYLPDSYTFILRIPGLPNALITSNDVCDLAPAIKAHTSELVYTEVLTRKQADDIYSKSAHYIQWIIARDLVARTKAGKPQAETTIRLPANSLKALSIEEQLERTRQQARMYRERKRQQAREQHK